MTATLRVGLYSASQKSQWDHFVLGSKNGTFLFLRDYMDYHRDRFTDHSLVIRVDEGALLAVVPANRADDTLVSHGGLTYGGLVVDERMRSVLMLDVFERMLAFLRERGIRTVIYKTVPHIYHRVPAEEDQYALFRFGATLARRDVLSVVQPCRRVPFQERRARGIRKAETGGVRIAATDDYDGFWRILEANLQTAHHTKPVHTCAEIRRLQAAFPDRVKLFGAFLGGGLVAGSVIYETETVAHAQYIAASEQGRSSRALDLLFSHLIDGIYRDKAYFDFGISTEDGGQALNDGLIEFKEGFGARAVMHDFYEIRTGV